MQFIDLKTQAKRIEEKVLNRIKAIIDHGMYIMGPEVEELETTLAKFVGVEYAITVSSGTDALLIALMALDVKPGDEIITTPFSFFATAEVIVLLGAKPIFVDIDPNTYNIAPSAIEAVITPKTKAIIPVSLYGQCANFDVINQIADKYNLPVIEDAAQSFGAEYKGKRSCALSTIGCTSFFPSKPLGAYGDGGACFTNDPELAKRMIEIRSHGQSQRYYHTSIGVNGRCDTMQAAILIEKMALFEEEIELRQLVATRYNELLPTSLKKQFIEKDNLSVYAQYTIEVKDRESLQKALNARGIPTAVHYPLGLHEQPIIKSLYNDNKSFPITEYAAQHVISLPMHPYLSLEDQKHIVAILIEEISKIEQKKSIEEMA